MEDKHIFTTSRWKRLSEWLEKTKNESLQKIPKKKSKQVLSTQLKPIKEKVRYHYAREIYTKFLTYGLIALILGFLGIGTYFGLQVRQKNEKPIPNPVKQSITQSPTISLTTTSSPDLDPTTNWKTYSVNFQSDKISFQAPSDWKERLLPQTTGPMFDGFYSPDGLISLLVGNGENSQPGTQKQFSSINEYLSYYKIPSDNTQQISLNGLQATKVPSTIINNGKDDVGYSGVFFLSEDRKRLTSLEITIETLDETKLKEGYTLFDQILSTLKFQENSEGKFCGGIAALRCPEGYFCKLDGFYPDAGGTCIKR